MQLPDVNAACSKKGNLHPVGAAAGASGLFVGRVRLGWGAGTQRCTGRRQRREVLIGTSRSISNDSLDTLRGETGKSGGWWVYHSTPLKNSPQLLGGASPEG